MCILDQVPDLRRGKSRPKLLTFAANPEGVEAFLALEFDGAVMEPTGGHYSKIWAHHLAKANRDLRWVGHWEVASYRESWKMFNKSDRLDAIALACYGLERWDKPWLFIYPSQAVIRDFYLQLEHLNRAKNPIVNRLRQQLCHEFPEVSERQYNRTWLNPNTPGLLKALSGDWTDKWRKEYEKTIGTGIGPFTIGLAKQLIQIETLEYELERQIATEFEREDYQRYLKIFEAYEIRDRTAAALLSVIHPIDKFLRDGKPITEKVTTSNDKLATRNRSIASFKLACGVGMIWHQSGDYEGWVAGGRADIRTALWRWCKTAIVMTPARRGGDLVFSPQMQKLHAYYHNGSRQIINGEEIYFDPGIRNQRVMRTVRRMLEMLFRDLVRNS